MKKALDMAVTLCALCAAVFLGLMTGPKFLKLQGGAEPLGDREFGETEGQYVSYEAAYPVASLVEEYYSGNPDRVRQRGYVVYDEVRKGFVYVVVSDRDDGDFSDLMRKLNSVTEMREGRDMTPVPVRGTLRAAEAPDAQRIMDALEESDIVDLYGSFEGQEEYFETYYGDEYGKLMRRMCRELAEGGVQGDWYILENKKIDGMEFYEIWVAFLAMALSFLIFVGRLILLLKGNGQKAGGKLPESGGRMERLMEAQRGWVTDWCSYSRNRGRRSIYLTVAGCVAVLVVIGLLVNTTLERTLVFHLPLGLLLGETVAVLFWLAQRGRTDPDKMLNRMRKCIDKALSSSGEQERFAEDMLDAGPEWNFEERKKDSLIRGTLGSRYWVVFTETGMAIVIDSDRIGEMETEHITGQVRSGKARIRYEYYVVRFFDRNSANKKSFDKEISFRTEDGRGDFMILVRRRKGEDIRIRAV